MDIPDAFREGAFEGPLSAWPLLVAFSVLFLFVGAMRWVERRVNKRRRKPPNLEISQTMRGVMG